MPYSIGHEVLLLKERNPFVIYTPEFFATLPLSHQIFAVKRAVLVCSQNDKQNSKPHRWLRLWGWLTRKADYAVAIADFRNYITEGRTLPHPPSNHAVEVLYGKEDEKGRAMGSPLMAQLYNYVSDNLDKFGLTPQTAWDASYALAGMLYFSDLESEGRMRIENAKEAEEQAALEKIEREIDEEAKVGNNNAGLATPPPDLS